jgi:hypothetical protein
MLISMNQVLEVQLDDFRPFFDRPKLPSLSTKKRLIVVKMTMITTIFIEFF